MKAITLHLGLDVHKDSNTIANDIDRLEKALSRIRKAHPAAASGPFVLCDLSDLLFSSFGFRDSPSGRAHSGFSPFHLPPPIS